MELFIYLFIYLVSQSVSTSGKGDTGAQAAPGCQLEALSSKLPTWSNSAFQWSLSLISNIM
jgi:hypothetical protein